jgi:hypothetical protein
MPTHPAGQALFTDGPAVAWLIRELGGQAGGERESSGNGTVVGARQPGHLDPGRSVHALPVRLFGISISALPRTSRGSDARIPAVAGIPVSSATSST